MMTNKVAKISFLLLKITFQSINNFIFNSSKAEQNVEELESRIRELERLLSRGEKLPAKEKEAEPVRPVEKEPDKKVVIEVPRPEASPAQSRAAPSNLNLPGTGRPGSNSRRKSTRGKKR